MLSSFRVIKDPPMNGGMNMALDQAILESTLRGESAITLRFYSWQPACLSLGYNQSISDLKEGLNLQYGRDLVRRMTGGRAVLHDRELTYSLTTPIADAFSGSIRKTCAEIHMAIAAALNRCGIEVTFGRANNYTSTPICFSVAMGGELLVDGKKVVGSAQMRHGEILLQHGSISLEESGKIASYFKNSSPDFHAGSDLLKGVSVDQLTSEIVNAISERFELTPKFGSYTENELVLANGELYKKYCSEEWTCRRSD